MFTKKETDFCKGIAIILMLFHHLFYKPASYEAYSISFWPFTLERVNYFSLIAKLCVAMFVFFSGYGMAVTWRKNFQRQTPSSAQIWNFTWKRYWKLMCGYWFIFALTLLYQPLGHTIFDAYGSSKTDLLAFFLIDFLGLADLFSTSTLCSTWWYMSFAVAVIFILPLLMRGITAYGPGFLAAVGFACIYLLRIKGTPISYFMVFLIGIACCEFSVFQKADRIGHTVRFSPVIKVLLELVLIYVLVKLRLNHNYYRIIDGLLTLMIALVVHTFLIHIPILTDFMQLLGRHSANIFLLHNQLYSMYFKDFYYSMKHWGLILLALLLTSLLCSVIIEQVKKWIHYNTYMERLGQKLLRTESEPGRA